MLPRIHIKLRTSQAEYLAFIAQREEMSLSRVFGAVIDHYGAPIVLGRPARKREHYIVITAANLAVLDRLAAGWGLTRSDAARRLIDAARAEDPEMAA